MANSDNKRRGAGNVPGVHVIYPVPDGAIDDLDRMQATGFYPLAAGEPAAVVVADEDETRRPAPGGALGYRRRQIVAVTREYRDAEDELMVLTWL